MTSYSPDMNLGLAIRPSDGATMGATGSWIMLATMATLQPVSGLSAVDLLKQLGAMTLSDRFPQPTDVGYLLTGLAIHLSLGALFGLLYALCQQRDSVSGLAAAAAGYGLELWIAGEFVGRLAFTPGAFATLSSWPWFLACLSYVSFLLLGTLYCLKRHPASTLGGELLD